VQCGSNRIQRVLHGCVVKIHVAIGNPVSDVMNKTQGHAVSCAQAVRFGVERRRLRAGPMKGPWTA
jgi:hypothetical protein